MRTRKQSRNFGLDITNFDQASRQSSFYSTRSRKLEMVPSVHDSQELNSNTVQPEQKISDQRLIEERLDEILSFGYGYFGEKTDQI